MHNSGRFAPREGKGMSFVSAGWLRGLTFEFRGNGATVTQYLVTAVNLFLT